MKKNSVVANYILNAIYQVLIIIVPLITTPYVSRVLGAEGIGKYSYTYSIISYLLIFAAMGTTTYGQRTIAYFQDDLYKRSCKFFEIVIFRGCLTLGCIFLYVTYLVGPLCKYKNVAIVQSIYLISLVFDVSWFFQGMEDFKRLVFRNTVAKIFNIVLIFLFVKDKGDVISYTLILSGMTFIANISIWPYLPSLIKKVKLKDLHPFSNFKEIFLLFIPTVAIQINGVLDKTMIGSFAMSAAENGYYEQTDKVVRMALAVVTSLGTVMIPRISKLYFDKKYDEMQNYINKSYQMIWLMGVPIMFGITAISSVFVPVFYGIGFDKIKILLPIYCCMIIPVALSNVTGCQFLIPTKQQNVYSLAVVLSTIVNIIFNVILIPKYLSIGASIASVSAEIVGALVMLIYVNKKNMIKIKDIFTISIKKWIAGIIMYVVVKILSFYLAISIMSLIILIAIGGITYLLGLMVLKDEFLMNILENIYQKFLKKREGN